jgi:DNA adenine methylase
MSGFLRWAGSKRQILPDLMEAMPEKFERYVEPFAGSACLFFEICPKQALIGDINNELIRTYRQIKKNVAAVLRSLRRFRSGETEYYKVRSANPATMSGPRRAARFIYLNRFCFNGLFRTNRLGKFNVPYGGVRSGKLPTSEILRSCAKSLTEVKLVSGSFEKTLEQVTTGDFVYLDPPYCISARRVFNEYSHFSFGDAELSLLRVFLEELDRVGIPFLVSYGVSREAYTLAKGFRCRQLVVRRQIAGFAAKRRKGRELLITNY